MIDLNPDIVRAVVERAREFQAEEAVVFPDEEPAPGGEGAWDLQALGNAEGDTVLDEGRALVNDLEPDQQVTLMALMWVGRGDFGPDEWDDALEQARELYTGNTADVLFATPMVADYLEEGLAAFGYGDE